MMWRIVQIEDTVILRPSWIKASKLFIHPHIFEWLFYYLTSGIDFLDFGLLLRTISGYSQYTVNSWQLELKSISPGFSSYISLNFRRLLRVVFTPSAKQQCQFFVFTFLSLQLKFSVHSCILRCLIAFPPHQFAYLLISVYIVCFKLPITRTLHNSNFFRVP